MTWLESSLNKCSKSCDLRTETLTTAFGAASQPVSLSILTALSENPGSTPPYEIVTASNIANSVNISRQALYFK